MTADAEKFASEDAKKKELVEAKNLAETLVYTSEKMVKDNDAKIKEEDKKDISEKAEALKTALKGENLDEIKKASDELSKVAQKVGGELYSQQQAQGQQQGNPAPGQESSAGPEKQQAEEVKN